MWEYDRYDPKKNMVNDLVSNPHPKEVLVKRGKKGFQKAWGPAYPTQVDDVLAHKNRHTVACT